MMRWFWFVSAVTFAAGLWAGAAAADTLILRNGTRIEGRLIGLRNGVFEFEERRGSRRRTIRVEQAEVRTIDLDPDGGGPRVEPIGPGDHDGDRDRDRDRGDERDRDGDRDRDQGAARPRGLREREVMVSARSPWTDSGIQVRNGQVIYFEAKGRIRWGRDRQDGPEGENNSPRNPNRPIPSRPGASLIGRIGTDAPFFIGSETDGIRVRGSGALFLGINDDAFEDNSGSFRVTIYY